MMPEVPADADDATEAQLLETLDELCTAHSPAGCEREIDAAITRRLEGIADRVWQDAAGNVIARFAGASDARPLLLNAHKDEIALVVKRIEDDGRMRVRPVGGAHPWKYGEGPVDLLADDGSAVPAALCFGSTHVSEESPIAKVKSGQQGLTWQMAYVDAKLSRPELDAAGIHAGTKVALERSRKRPRRLGRHVCAHALDDKAGVALLLLLAQRLRDGGGRLAQDVYFVFSSMEEVNGGSAVFAARQLGGEAMLGLEIVPAMPEYGVKNDARPVLVHVDGVHIYDERLTHRAAALAAERGIEVQHAVLASFGSDPGIARRGGGVPRAALLGFPADNTHGYEIAHLDAMRHCLTLAEALVHDWPSA
jgi:putative aminopeptidase FrvX